MRRRTRKRTAPDSCVVAAVLLLAFGFGALTTPPEADAVVGGTPAALADFPYFATVGTGCGGALIAPDRVLTAAHCEEVIGERPVVRVGPDRIKRQIALRAAHPVTVRERNEAQNEAPAPADLLVLQLRRPIARVAPVAIADPAENSPGMQVTTIGRGATRPDGGGRGSFRTGVVRVQEQSTCAAELPTALWRRWSLCTRDPRLPDPTADPPFVSACIGDSGGPQLTTGAAGPSVIGVVSFGPYCGARRDPEVYADVSAARGFVLAAQPPWAPSADRRPQIKGTPKAGRRLRCAVAWTARPTRRLRYEWFSEGRFLERDQTPVLRVRKRYRGQRLLCAASGATRGGFGYTLNSRPVRIKP